MDDGEHDGGVGLIRPLAATPGAALVQAAEDAPYLARLMRRFPDIDGKLSVDGVAHVLREALGDIRAAADLHEADAMVRMRVAKARAHLAIAGGDLSGTLALMPVVEALSDLADAALGASLAVACREEGTSDAGLFVIGLGKLGARELNYSSDVDVAVFYDATRFQGGARTPAETASRVARRLVRLMEAVTEDGYVFRTDLRLRPDPRSTPPAVSVQMAEIYYETVGQNWERMVYIKARPVAGDASAAQDFLKGMTPYVWRRHLDYWAIGDIHAIKRQINRVGDHATLDAPDADVKLGPGGIREIEFYAQTQQLILGGRRPELRAPRTRDALDRLVETGHVPPADRDFLVGAYHGLRGVEHRIQMVQDEQTHTLPNDPEARMHVARLCGHDTLDAFDAAVRAVRSRVNGLYAALFGQEERRAHESRFGNLVFTGVDHDPGTLATLTGMGFRDAGVVIDAISDWHRGKIPATRTVRGREILTALVPELLGAIAATGEPDLAFRRFGEFFGGLTGGVQVMAMLLAQPKLLTDVTRTLALAPRLSGTLARRPGLLEALLHDTGDGLEALAACASLPFAEGMDAARQIHREAEFRIGFAVLNGALSPREAGERHAALAEACIVSMARLSHRETQRRYGPAPGLLAVCGMGKLGGREMSAGSDLDLIVVYEEAVPGSEVESSRLDARSWFTRYTQTLITALSAATAEGVLYEVDMALRPSGRAGPVAVSLASFLRYHREESWTWEHMALTRLRPIHAEGDLGARIGDGVRAVLSRPRDLAALRADVADMRARMARERPGQGLWDLKLDAGGLVDVEFIVQHALLAQGLATGALVQPGTADAIAALAGAGAFTVEEAATLAEALEVLLGLQQVTRVSVAGQVEPNAVSSGLGSLLARAVGCAEFSQACQRLERVKAGVAAIRERRIGPLATETGAVRV
jgi:glutamate-ammonia-ligase adenylyltransferase